MGEIQKQELMRRRPRYAHLRRPRVGADPGGRPSCLSSVVAANLNFSSSLMPFRWHLFSRHVVYRCFHLSQGPGVTCLSWPCCTLASWLPVATSIAPVYAVSLPSAAPLRCQPTPGSLNRHPLPLLSKVRVFTCHALLALSRCHGVTRPCHS